MPLLLIILLFLVATGQTAGILSVRAALLTSLTVMIFIAARMFPKIDGTDRLRAAGLIGASLAIQVLPELLRPSTALLYEVGWRATLVMLSWSFALSLLSYRQPSSQSASDEHLGGGAGIAMLLIGTFIGLVTAHQALRSRYAIIVDEVLYLTQSRTLVQPGFTRHLDSFIAPFFLSRQGFVLNDRFSGQYTPGWPLLLALFNIVGLRWFAPICLGVLAVGATYLLGRQLRSHKVGLLAGAFLATTYQFVFLCSTYFSHASSIALCVASAWLLVKAEVARKRTKPLLWVLAGLLLGMAISVRPLTGVALAVSLGIWILSRRRVGRWDYVRMAVAMTTGTALPIVFVLYYNNIVTGHPLLFGYHLANKGLQDLGFGLRGVVFQASDGSTGLLVENFTPRVALVHALRMVRSASLEFSPAFILAPLVFFGFKYRLRFSWVSVIAFLALPILHFFYWYEESRFYSELLPFFFVGIGILLADLWAQNRRVSQWLIAFILVGNLLFTGQGLLREYRGFHGWFLPYFNGVTELHRERGKLLVFVRERSRLPVLFDALSWFNVDDFPGDIIVARDLGARNTDLVRRWPDHLPFLVTDHGIGERPQEPQFIPLSGLVMPGGDRPPSDP
jgi:hypothetical protein